MDDLTIVRRVVGEWFRDASTDEFILHTCPTGHNKQNESLDIQKCEKCKENYYIVDSNDPTATCTRCPRGAICPNGAPPIFEPKSVECSMELPDFPPGSGDPAELALQALADMLGMDVSMIELTDSSRRAPVSFVIHGNAEDIAAATAALEDPVAMAAGLSAQLQKNNNITVTISVSEPVIPEETGEKKRPGEVWQEENGLYILKACGPGTLLVNSTIEDQVITHIPPSLVGTQRSS
jgi:hypothetical protein